MDGNAFVVANIVADLNNSTVNWRMNMPWGLIAIFFALSLFYYVSRQTKARNEERRDRLNESRQAYLDSLLKKSKSETRREGEKEDETHSPDRLDHE